MSKATVLPGDKIFLLYTFFVYQCFLFFCLCHVLPFLSEIAGWLDEGISPFIVKNLNDRLPHITAPVNITHSSPFSSAQTAPW